MMCYLELLCLYPQYPHFFADLENWDKTVSAMLWWGINEYNFFSPRNPLLMLNTFFRTHLSVSDSFLNYFSEWCSHFLQIKCPPYSFISRTLLGKLLDSWQVCLAERVNLNSGNTGQLGPDEMVRNISSCWDADERVEQLWSKHHAGWTANPALQNCSSKW